MERSVAAAERRKRSSDWSTSTRRSLRAHWGRSERTRASWPERSSVRSWKGAAETLSSKNHVHASVCGSLYITFAHSAFQGCRQKEESEGADGQLGHPGGRVESPEEEEEVTFSTSSPHCLTIFKRTSPAEPWLIFTWLKYVEFSISTCLTIHFKHIFYTVWEFSHDCRPWCQIFGCRRLMWQLDTAVGRANLLKSEYFACIFLFIATETIMIAQDITTILWVKEVRVTPTLTKM